MLELSSPRQAGYFFIKNGEIKGGEVGKLRGAAAIELAGSFVDASFQFKSLEPTDYPRVVWEKSYGSNRLVADPPDIRVEAFPTMLQQVRKKLLPAWWKALAEWQIALRRNKEIVLKYARALSFQGALALIRKRAPMLPSLQQVAQSNISFGVVVVAIVVGTAVIISQILPGNQDSGDTVVTPDENVGTQSQVQPRHVSRERAKRKRRIGRQTPTDKKRDTRAQEPRFLPQLPVVQPPRNAASNSDVPNPN